MQRQRETLIGPAGGSRRQSALQGEAGLAGDQAETIPAVPIHLRAGGIPPGSHRIKRPEMTPSEAAERAAQNAVDKFVEFMQQQDSQNTLTMALGGMMQGGFLPMDAINTINEFLQRTFIAGFEAGSDVAFIMAMERFREIVDEVKESLPNPNQPWFKDPERLIGERLRDEF